MTTSGTGTMGRLLTGAALLGALAGARPVDAQMRQINELHTLRVGAVVNIEVISHSIVVEGWDRNEIQITGQYDPSIEEMEIENDDGGTFSFELEQPDGPRRDRGVRRGTDVVLEVKMPRGGVLELETVSGAVTVTGFTGALDASSVSGRVEVTGTLDLVELTTVSGRVRYAGDSPAVTLESVSGSVDYSGNAGYVRLEAVSGPVMMDGGAETIEAESVSGPVRVLSRVPVQSLDASSVSGGVDFRGPLAPAARVDVESHSGPVDLQLVGSVAARFELESFSGSVQASLPGMRDVVENRSRMTPAESLRFVTGTGTGRVDASSFSGGVRISEARQ